MTLTGVAWRNAIFSSVDGYYRAERREWRGRRLGPDLRHRVGLYDYEPIAGDRFEAVAITGIVDTCERRARVVRRENEEASRRAIAERSGEIVIMLLSGYCHFVGGPVLRVTEFRSVGGTPPERRIGPDARDRIGSLIPATMAWRHYRQIGRLAASLRNALASGDRAALSALHGRRGADRQALDYLLADPASPFRELRVVRDAKAIILIAAVDWDGQAADDRRRDRDSFICFCRGPDCARLWPIAPVDTWHDPDHPFACFEVSEDGRGNLSIDANQDDAPLREPGGRAQLDSRSALPSVFLPLNRQNA